MFVSKIILPPVFIFGRGVFRAVAKQAANDWSIADYVKNLSEKYITASGDFPKPAAKTKQWGNGNLFLSKMP